MTTKKALFQLLYLVIHSLFSECIALDATRIISNTSNFSVGCVETERTTLLKFKGSLKDPLGRLSSWVDEDCCEWEGVGCNNRTGNVVKLDLKSPDDCTWESRLQNELVAKNMSCLGGELNPSLLDLKFLNYLDLSSNNFEGIVIPKFMGSFKHLSYLNLSSASFCGMVPPHLGNLSNLRYLNLYSYPCYYFDKVSWVSDLNWLSGLSSLKYLDLEYVNLSLAKSDWLQPINMLHSLSELHLSSCELRHLPQTLPFINLTSLLVLNLQLNNFNSSIPQWVLNMSTLTDIDLSYCELYGPFSEVAMGDLCNLHRVSLASNKFEGETINFLNSLSRCYNSRLEELDLSHNKLGGTLADSLQNLQNLKSLQLSSNSFSGSIPTFIGKMSSLEELNLFDNSWEGVISEIHFLELKNLTSFSISSSNSSFTFHVREDWIPSFNLLRSFRIKNCRVGQKFPAWLQTQKYLNDITLANASISDTIPDWLWALSSNGLESLDLSGNQLRGKLPNTVNFAFGASVFLNSNNFEGSLPFWHNLTILSLRNNKFSGPIFEIGPEMQKLLILDLSGNKLTGSIPTSINKLQNLIMLDLSKNNLSRNIPRHWEVMKILSSIDLSSNKLSGDIPSSICSLPYLEWLKLNNNNLSGELSPSLKNCTTLMTLDLGENKFFGNLPKWMGERLSILSELRLRDNMFSGIIPEQLCNLSSLHVLDLAQNNLSGSIPPCLGNMIGFQYVLLYEQSLQLGFNEYYPQMELVMKGSKLVYNRTLELVNLIDLSNNNLRGDIPNEITNLLALGTLNLARNQLTGKIPEEIGALQQLETLDLSSNHLSGPIPPSMTSITFLSHLNLSCNNLSGQIPSTNQFSTWNDSSIYEGNQLCGAPLPTLCSTSSNGNNTEEDRDDDDEDEDRSYKLGLFVSVALGFIMGFWLVYGSLVIKKSWRDAYFRFLNEMKDRVYVFIVVNVARLKEGR